MALVAGTYNPVKNENFVEYLTAIGVPEEQAKQFNTMMTPLVCKLDGQQVSLSRHVQGDSVFTLGKEFDEKMPTGDVLKNVASLSGNTLTVKSTAQDGKSGQKIYEFSESGLVVTLTADSIDVVGKRIYKRA